MVWPNVSWQPLCTNTSRLAKMRASCPPRCWPRKTADGISRRSRGSAGPPPTMTSRTPGSAATPASSSTCFSGASRPTYPASTSPPGARARRSASLRAAGLNRWVSTPRPHIQTRCTPCAASRSMLALDGARVRSAALWMPRSQRHAAASAARPQWYARAYPGTSVWYTATTGSRSRRAARLPSAPRKNGLARWTSSARCPSSARRMAGEARPSRTLR